MELEEIQLQLARRKSMADYDTTLTHLVSITKKLCAQERELGRLETRIAAAAKKGQPC